MIFHAQRQSTWYHCCGGNLQFIGNLQIKLVTESCSHHLFTFLELHQISEQLNVKKGVEV